MYIRNLLIIILLFIQQGCVFPPPPLQSKSLMIPLIPQKIYKSDKPVIMFILDSSGSMASFNLEKGENKPKIEIAKSSIIDVINQVDKKRYNTSLITFDEKNACSAYLAVEPNNPDPDNIVNKINKIEAQGATPLAKAIALSGEVLSNVDKKLVILFSDGGESCSGDPVREAKKLYNKYNVKVSINNNIGLDLQVIGYAVDGAAEKQLQAIAEIGKDKGWKYHFAKDQKSLSRAISRITKGKLDPIWVDLLKATFQFSSGGSGIEAKYLEKIQKIAHFLKYNQKKIIIIGHTDSVGTNASNMILSLKRAETIKAKLIGLGININRMTVQGRGEKEPIKSNNTSEGRRKNRRVVFEIY